MHRAQSARHFGTLMTRSTTTATTTPTPFPNRPTGNAVDQNGAPTATTTTTTTTANPTFAARTAPTTTHHHHHHHQRTKPDISSSTTVPSSSSEIFPSTPAAEDGAHSFPTTAAATVVVASSSSPSSLSPNRHRAKKLDELAFASLQFLSFMSLAQDLVNSISEQKHQCFLNEIYEIAFVGVLSKNEHRKQQQNRSHHNNNTSNPFAEVGKADREFSRFVNDRETRDALKLGEDAVSLLNGGHNLSSSASSSSTNVVVQELQQQVEFWKSVAHSTHKHNAMLLEAKKMLEGSALRSSQLQQQVQSLTDQLAASEASRHEDVANSKKIVSERQSYIDQLGTVSEQLQKVQRKLEIHERQAVAWKKDKDKDQAALADKDKQNMSLQTRVRQANAAVELLTASLNAEKEAHGRVKHLYERIVNHRTTQTCQTDISGPSLMTEELMWDFTASRVAAMFDLCQSSLVAATEEAIRQKKNAEVCRNYADQALDSVDEAKRIQVNKDASWAEQVRQLKLEAEAECRRADEQKKKSLEHMQEAEQVRDRLRELERIVEEKYDSLSKLRRGALKHQSTQSETSYDPKSGNRRALNTLSMSSQTEEGWYSMLSVEASHRITEQMRREKLDKILRGQGGEEGEEAKNQGTSDANNNTTDKNNNNQKNNNNSNSRKPVTALLLSNTSHASDNMQEGTILSGRKAKDSIAVARESVRKILSGGLNTSGNGGVGAVSSQQLQRKELLGVIRALSEAITLSAAHIKDLEGEIERIVGEVFDAKPSTDQCVSVTTDVRGNLIVDGGRLFSAANVKHQSLSASHKSSTAIVPEISSASPSSSVSSAPTLTNRQLNFFDFGFGSSEQPLSPIRKSGAVAVAAAADGSLISHHSSSSLVGATLSPDVVALYMNSKSNISQVNPKREQNFDAASQGYNVITTTNEASTATATDKSKRAPASNLQHLLERGASLEQQQQQHLPQSQSSLRPRSNSGASSSVLSRIEAVQKHSQMILDESSPLALRRDKNHSSNPGHSARKASFLIPPANEHGTSDDTNLTAKSQQKRRATSSSPSSPSSPSSTTFPEWSSSTSIQQPLSLKLRKEAHEQENRHRQKQLPTAAPNSASCSRSSSVNSTHNRNAHIMNEMQLQQQIYQEENSGRTAAGSRLRHIEDPERNPFAREFYDQDGRLAANQSLRGDTDHVLVGGESTPLLFPHNRMLLSQQQQQPLRKPVQTGQQQEHQTSHFSPTKFNFG